MIIPKKNTGHNQKGTTVEPLGRYFPKRSSRSDGPLSLSPYPSLAWQEKFEDSNKVGRTDIYKLKAGPSHFGFGGCGVEASRVHVGHKQMLGE